MRRVRRMAGRAKRHFPHPLAWLLVWMGAMYQVAFVIPNSSAHSSMLYISLANIDPMLPLMWGAPGVVALLIGIAGMLTGNKIMTRIASTVQVMLWVFALGVYLEAGIFFLAMAIAFVQVCFWAWNFTMREYELE